MKVTKVKRKTPSPFTHGSKYRAKKRGRSVGVGNKGRYSRRAANAWKRNGAKPTKKTNLVYTCTVCNKKLSQKKGIRTKRLELI
jgi:ribosomal protein L44E